MLLPCVRVPMIRVSTDAYRALLAIKGEIEAKTGRLATMGAAVDKVLEKPPPQPDSEKGEPVGERP